VSALGGSGRGLRSRLVVGYVWVTIATALITAGTAVVGMIVVIGTRPARATRLAGDLFNYVPRPSLSDSGLLWLLVAAIVGLLAISVGAGLLAAKRVLQPVRTLASAAERVAAGDLGVRLEPSGDDELAQLVTTFNGMTANLGKSVEELRRLEARARRFASDVSHELRTPLAAMTAVTDVLSAETAGMSPDAARAAQLVITETEHLRLLVNDLIEMSRFDAGTAALDVDVLDIATVVSACLALRGWTDVVATEVPEGMAAVLDRRRFDIALANVVGNAVRYGAPPVHVTAAARRDGARSWLDVTVTDCGPGLPPDALSHVFERFYKADAARTRSDGSGLGLAIALENVRLHGGTLEAVNRPEGGAEFTLRLPMHASPVSDRPASDASPVS
jgi:two-component system, OmpR family, sensor histidine kinase MtrB